MMLNDCSYNKIKLLHELSSLSWFLEKHALNDAEIAKQSECKKMLEKLKQDLDANIKNIENLMKCPTNCTCNCGCEKCMCKKK